MKLTIESTTKIVTLVVDGHEIPARVWQGETESGIPIHCFVTRVAVANDKGYDHSQFERELAEQRAARVDVEAIPLRLIL